MKKKNKEAKNYKELLFDKALKKIIDEERRGNNPIPLLNIYLQSKTSFLKNKFEILQKEIEEETVIFSNPDDLLQIDIPKPNFTLRPLARPSINFWLFYETFGIYLSEKILKKTEICNRSYSIGKFKNEKLNKSSTSAWLEFKNKEIEFFSKGYKYCVVTDLTSYYENINLNELRSRIIDYLENDELGEGFTKRLFELLRKWSIGRVMDYGLPQGPPASAFLADIYLDVVDRQMEEYEGYFRYMDDIRIFCKDERTAKIALKSIILALRKLKLHVNAKKTDILNKKSIKEKLFDPEKPTLKKINNIIKSKDKKDIEKFVIPGLILLFKKSFNDNLFSNTHLNFSLYRLGMLYNSGLKFDYSKIVKLIQENIVKKPYNTSLFCEFLSYFPNDEEIANSLISFLQSKDNIYEGQELKILQYLLRFNTKLEQPVINFFIESAQDSNKHYAVQGFYFILAGKFGNNRDRNIIIDCYHNEFHNYLKSAMVLSVQALTSSQKNFYNKIKTNTDTELDDLITYVKTLSEPKYFIETKKPKIETYEEDYEEYY